MADILISREILPRVLIPAILPGIYDIQLSRDETLKRLQSGLTGG